MLPGSCRQVTPIGGDGSPTGRLLAGGGGLARRVRRRGEVELGQVLGAVGVLDEEAQRVDQAHLLRGAGAGAEELGAADEDGEGLGSGYCHVEPVQAEEEFEVAGHVIGRGGGHGEDDDGGPLTLELVDRPDLGPGGEGRLEPGDVGVAGSDDEDVVHAERSVLAVLVNPPAPEEGLHAGRDFGGLFRGGDLVADVFDGDPAQAGAGGPFAGADALFGARGGAVEAAVVEGVGDEAADVGVHPPLDVEQDPPLGGDGGVAVEDVLEGRAAGAGRVCSLVGWGNC
ncbi:MAG: hypothetical protein QOD57_2460 [Actinomycetota bacterium]|nr:hypothetical protein [Actinomycetota bacterium]